MDRRLLLSGAALGSVALFASNAFAQTATAMGEAETKHAEQTGMVGSLSLLQSRKAVTKATDAKVKQFATWEVAEQETVGDILKSMKSDKAQGALMPPTDEEAMAMIDADGKAKLDAMDAMSGADFDKAYVAANLEGHKKLLAIQEDYLKVGTNREQLSVAKLARGSIKEHIDHLTELQGMAG